MSKTSLRKEYPGKFVFSVMVASPDRGGPAIEYEGTLQAATWSEAHAVALKILDFIEGKKL